MSRKLLTLLVIAIMTITIVMLSGCESFKYGPIAGGDAAAIVTGNGGLAVKQGEYLYFINGYADYDATDPKTNFFGEVLKGAIMRGKLNADGTLSDVAVVVPKKAMSSSISMGISVYGNWIYYVSPSTGTDNKRNVLTDYIDFYRTSIDGTESQKITTIKGNTTEYKYTSKALVYYLDSKLISIDLTNKKFTETIIDEEVTDVLFPNNPSYNPANVSEVADYIFYTKASENDLDINNVIYVVNPNAEGKKILIDKTTFTPDFATDLTEVYTITLLGSSVTDNKLAIYYTKKTIATVATQDKGLYGYEFADTSFTIVKENEKCFSLTTTAKIYPISFTKGVFILDSTPNVLAKAQGSEEIVPVKVTYDFTDITVIGVSAIGDKDYLYYLSSSILYRFALDQSENAAVVLTDKIKTGWAGPNIIDGILYYVNEKTYESKDYSYTYMAKLDTFNISDEDALVNIMIGTMTDADKETKAAADKAAEEAA